MSLVGLALVLMLAVVSSATTSGATSSGAAARAAACANDRTALSRLSARKVRAAVICLMNQERTRFGLPLLAQNGALQRAAQGFVNDMIKRDFFSHDAPAPHASTPPQRISAAGYDWATWGEDIAAGYPTALRAVTGWMSDAGHCFNVLDPLFADVGVGFVNKALPKYASQPALWIGDFGLKLRHKQPSANMQPANSCPHGF